MTASRSASGIFFLSDYGTDDEFVGVVHAVLFRLAPEVAVVDLSHRIPPFDVAGGAAMLVRCAPHLGPGVVLAVVDPGVGTGRRAVAVGTGAPPGAAPRWLVGPDNGLLVPVARALGGAERAVVITGTGGGGTFDGRDLFAPAAAHLALDGDPVTLGEDIDPADLRPLPDVASDAVPSAHRTALPDAPPDVVRRPGGPPMASGDHGPGIAARVSWVDRFGNVQLDLRPGQLSGTGLVPGGTALVAVAGQVRSRPARWVGAFAELDPGELGLLVDANGHLALVRDRAPASEALGGPGPGAQVVVVPDPPPDG